MKITAIILAAATLGVAAPALAGPLDGATVHAQYLFPTQGSIYQDFGETTVSGDTIIASSLGNVGGVDLHATGSNLTALFNQGYSTYWTSIGFNGFVVFDDTNTVGAITGVSINGATNMSGFDMSRISFDADHIFVNWQGLALNQGTVVSLDISSSGGAVPEPASWALMLGGFGAIGGAMRSRRKAAVSFG